MRSLLTARRLACSNFLRWTSTPASRLSRNRLASAARASAGSAKASLKISAAVRFMGSILTATTSRQERSGTRDRAVARTRSDRTADAARGAATKSGGCRPSRRAKTEEALRGKTRARLHRLLSKSLSACELQMSIVLNSRGVLCRATAVSRPHRPWIRGVSNPPVLPGHPSRTPPGGCSRPACRRRSERRDRARKVGC